MGFRGYQQRPIAAYQQLMPGGPTGDARELVLAVHTHHADTAANVDEQVGVVL